MRLFHAYCYVCSHKSNTFFVSKTIPSVTCFLSTTSRDQTSRDVVDKKHVTDGIVFETKNVLLLCEQT